jgi:hypothetical protein
VALVKKKHEYTNYYILLYYVGCNSWWLQLRSATRLRSASGLRSVISNSAPSTFLHYCPQIARIYADYFPVQEHASTWFDRLTNQAQQPCFDRLSNRLTECTPTSHELPATSQNPDAQYISIILCYFHIFKCNSR